MAAVGNELEALNNENVKNLYFEAPTTSTSGDFRACYRNIPPLMIFYEVLCSHKLTVQVQQVKYTLLDQTQQFDNTQVDVDVQLDFTTKATMTESLIRNVLLIRWYTALVCLGKRFFL